MKRSNLNLPVFRDPEFWFILAYNLIILYLFKEGKVDPYFVIWAFYLQSLLIGAEYVVGSIIYRRKQKDSGGDPGPASFTWFFVLHFGLFHLVYLIFLTVMSGKSDDVIGLIQYIKLTLAYLFLNLVVYAFSFSSKGMDKLKQPNGFLPYLRILPIHLFIIFGIQSDGIVFSGFLLFMGLKTFSDLILYAITRR